MQNIEISNQFTVKELSNFRNNTMSSITLENDIEIKMIDINNIDLSAIQYFVALKNVMEKNGKKINIKLQCNDATKQLISNSGCSFIFNF